MAVEAIHHAVELNPNNIDARMNLAAFYEDANQFEKAATLYEQVIKLTGPTGETLTWAPHAVSWKKEMWRGQKISFRGHCDKSQ